MDLIKAIYQRRATRSFSDANVLPALVHELINAAAQAPSALNLQPWAFAVFHGRDRLERYSTRAKAHLLGTSDPSYGLDPRIDQYLDRNLNIFHAADTLIVVCAKPSRFSPVEDCFLAAQNLMLAAHGFGLGSCPVGFARPWFNQPDVKAELDIPPHYTAVMPIVIGYAEQPPTPPNKHTAETVCWHWDE